MSIPHFTRRFRPEAVPADTRECFQSMRKAIPDISMLCPKSFHFREKCELKNSKKFIRLLSKSSVWVYTENSSDTGNLLKSDICDLQRLWGLETAASGQIRRLRGRQEAGPPTPPLLQRPVQHNAVRRMQKAPA